MRRREDVELLVIGDDLPRHRMEGHEPLDVVSEHLDAHGMRLIDREDLQGVTTDTERPPLKTHVIACVLNIDQAPEQTIPIVVLPHAQAQHAIHVLLRGPQAIDRRDGGNDDDIATSQERIGGRMPKPFDLLIDRRILLDVRIRLRDIGLRLVVVIVRNEVLDRVIGKKLPELICQLRGQRLIRGHHQSGTLEALDEPGRGGTLARAGRTQQHDVPLPSGHPLTEVLDCRRLITRGDVIRNHLKGCNRADKIGDRAHDVSLGALTTQVFPEVPDLLFQRGNIPGVVQDDGCSR